MKQYLVEVRFGYDVRADTADEALRLVSPASKDDEVIAVEYSVRERHEPPRPIESKSPDLHGLTKARIYRERGCVDSGNEQKLCIRTGEARCFQYAAWTKSSYPKKHACRLFEWRTSAEVKRNLTGTGFPKSADAT